MTEHRGRRFALPPASKEQFGNHHNCNILQKHCFSPFSPFRRRWCSSSLPPTWPLAAVRLLRNSLAITTTATSYKNTVFHRFHRFDGGGARVPSRLLGRSRP